MNHTRRFFSPWARVLGAGVVVLCAGCSNLMLVKEKVTVDAISAPGTPKPAGQSYRLVAKRSMVTAQQAQVAVIKACVDAALTRQGMYEAPAKVPSDVFIEIAYGMDTTSHIDAAFRESFLDLSARANRQHTLDSTQEEQLWDVRTSISGLAGPLETAMPLLATVASQYVGTDTRAETVVEVPQKSPDVLAVREMAMKTLERLAPASGAAAPAAASTSAAATTPAAPAPAK